MSKLPVIYVALRNGVAQQSRDGCSADRQRVEDYVRETACPEQFAIAEYRHVILCADCRRWVIGGIPDSDGRKWCLRFERFMAPDDFCSGAKKRAEPAERSKG